MKVNLNSEVPPPRRMKKGRKKLVDQTEEYLMLTQNILNGRSLVGRGQHVLLPNDKETKDRFGSKDPARALSLALIKFIKNMRIPDTEIVRFQPADYPAGYWVVEVKHTIDHLRSMVPRSEPIVVGPRYPKTLVKRKRTVEPVQAADQEEQNPLSQPPVPES